MKKRPVRLRVDENLVSRLLWSVNRMYCKTFHRFAWSGPDPIPKEGGALLSCNHRSSVDPFILSATTERVISFLIAEEYYRIPLLRSVFRWMGCIPVKRDQNDAGAVRKALRAIKAGRLVCIFPEGGINRGIEHSRIGVGYLCLRSGAPVIPAHVQGTPQAGSVWVSLLRRSRSTARFGNPYYPPHLPQNNLDREVISQVTAEIIASLESL